MTTAVPAKPKMISPMFEMPTLGLLLNALEDLHRSKRYGFLWRQRSPRALRIPCRFLIVSLCEEGGRELTLTERQLLRQAVRRYIHEHPMALVYLEAFLD
jgi:hypothetical protein